MTCKDCIHYRACNVCYTAVREEAELCECFKAAGLVVELPCKVGDTVWIVERDDCGNACQVSGFRFMGLCNNAVIATVVMCNHNDDFDYIIQRHIEETAEEYETDLSVFPVDDMYLTRAEAEKALEEME